MLLCIGHSNFLKLRHPLNVLDNRMNPASATKSAPLHWGTDVTMRAIRRYVRQVAELFDPDQIILFGSHAYGQLNADSDVDLLVVMPTRNSLDQVLKIRLAIPAPFPLDLLVRTPETLKWRLEEGDCFLREIVSRGKVLYEKARGRVRAKSRARMIPIRNKLFFTGVTAHV